MPGYKAFEDFKATLRLAETLMNIERDSCSYPPRATEQDAVAGLRGGAAVLMVAAFEEFLKRTFAEHLSKLSGAHVPVKFDDLPDDMRVTGTFIALERALKGSEFAPPPRIERLSTVKHAAGLVAAGVLIPEAFCSTQANPNSNTVKALFKNVGISQVFDKIRPAFNRKWPKAESNTFLVDKLDEIVQRRHKVAHTAMALDITRSDLRESLRFLTTLADVLDKELEKYISKILGS